MWEVRPRGLHEHPENYILCEDFDTVRTKTGRRTTSRYAALVKKQVETKMIRRLEMALY